MAEEISVIPPTITLDDLFRARSTISVGETTFYVRALSDFEVQAREEYAALTRARLRRALKNPDSEEYMARLDWIEGAEDELLVQLCVSAARSDLVRRASDEIAETLFPLPDKAEPDEADAVRHQRENERTRVIEARAKWVVEKVEASEKALRIEAREVLERKARHAQSETYLWNTWVVAFNSYTIFAGVYRDAACKERLVASEAAARELDPRERNEIVNAYLAEFNRIQAMDLKYFLSTGGSPDTSKPSNGSGSGETPRT